MASPLFPIYEAEWGIGHGTITLLYVAYMCGVLAALLFLSRLTDSIGAVRALRIGSALLMAGLFLSAFVPGVVGFLPVRMLIGIASGLITSSATIGLFRLEPGEVRAHRSSHRLRQCSVSVSGRSYAG